MQGGAKKNAKRNDSKFLMKRCVFGVYGKCPAPGLKGRALSYRLERGIMVLKPLVPFSSSAYVDAYGPVVPLPSENPPKTVPGQEAKKI